MSKINETQYISLGMYEWVPRRKLLKAYRRGPKVHGSVVHVWYHIPQGQNVYVGINYIQS